MRGSSHQSTNPATVKSAMPHESGHFVMRHRRRLMHQRVVCQQLFATAFVADEKLARTKS
jgi:predicted Zn-dependent protease